MPERTKKPRLRQRTVEIRALPDEGEGVFEAYVTKYNVPYKIDYWGKEQIEPGCFDESIAANPKIPVFWMHAWRDGLLIGDADASSDDVGVIAKGQLWMDIDVLAQKVWRGMMSGAIREWSIGYYVQIVEFDEQDDDLEHIHKGELIEASSVVRGANPETETIDVRAMLRSVLGVKDETVADRELVERLRRELPDLRQRAKDRKPPETPDTDIDDDDDDIEDVDWSSLMNRPTVREMFRDRVSS